MLRISAMCYVILTFFQQDKAQQVCAVMKNGKTKRTAEQNKDKTHNV